MEKNSVITGEYSQLNLEEKHRSKSDKAFIWIMIIGLALIGLIYAYHLNANSTSTKAINVNIGSIQKVVISEKGIVEQIIINNTIYSPEQIQINVEPLDTGKFKELKQDEIYYREYIYPFKDSSLTIFYGNGYDSFIEHFKNK